MNNILKTITSLLVCLFSLTCVAQTGANAFPTSGIYRHGNFYRVHDATHAALLRVDDKADYPVHFSYQAENLGDGRSVNVVAHTDSTYTTALVSQSKRRAPRREQWLKTEPEGIVMSIINTLTDHDNSHRIYGTYFRKCSPKDDENTCDHREVVYLTPYFAITGHGNIRFTEGEEGEFSSFNGTIHRVTYPNDHQFMIEGKTYTIDASAFNDRNIYALNHPVDLYGNGKKFEKLCVGIANGFVWLDAYLHNALMVTDFDKVSGAYVGETRDSVCYVVQDNIWAAKQDVSVSTWRPSDGQGMVYANVGRTAIRRSPDKDAAIVGWLTNPGGEELDGSPCLGIDGAWYKIAVEGQKEPAYVLRSECYWWPF